MTLEEKLLSLKIEGFYLEESVLSPTEAAEAYASTKATLQEGSGRIFGSTFLNHNQCLAPYLAAPQIMEVVVAMLGSSARIISTSGNLREPTAHRLNQTLQVVYTLTGPGVSQGDLISKVNCPT